MKMSLRRGFTLIEVLLVVVIIAILAGIVIIAVNPGRQISQTNNAQRTSDVKAVVSAIHQYAIDNRGTLPDAITGDAAVMGVGDGLVDICDLLVPTYIAEMPFDPTAEGAAYTDCDTYNTGYTVSMANGRVTVAAPGAELEEVISVTE